MKSLVHNQDYGDWKNHAWFFPELVSQSWTRVPGVGFPKSSRSRLKWVPRRVPDIAWFIWMLIIACALPMITTDHACAVLDVAVDRELFSTVVLDAEEAITRVFERTLRTR
ncbi:hypothetical protein BS47DRAFT_1346817 [Hydnum rufescens UP504]|uniref:Uncharacterized protein n=1 Tax=Hydnum rufescens UP504 TaxID=1448309 RepID=A0A9P6AT32_9AGAM|nr:hypothetical protein BS47DRAFT_1346817 [Hydnum rufescens UP504]